MEFFFFWLLWDGWGRLQWVFDSGGFANTMSLDLVVGSISLLSHFFSNSVVGGGFGLGLASHWWWVALQFVGLCLQLGVGLFLVVVVVFCWWIWVVITVVLGCGHEGGFGDWILV